jgi:hypothetical protein
MYIRPTRRKYKNKVYENHLLVESVHTPKGPRQRTVCSLGDLGPKPRQEWLKLVHRVEEALVGQGDLFEASDEETQAFRRQGYGRPHQAAISIGAGTG